jgi:hypothetical protein
MYCVKLEWQDVDTIIWLINYADPSGALGKPLIDNAMWKQWMASSCTLYAWWFYDGMSI